MTDERIAAFLAAPQPYLADGGLETSMVFHEGFELPAFAAFTLLESDAGRAALTRYFERYIGLAREAGTGFVLDTVTWRANAPWIARMGRPAGEIARANRAAVDYARQLRDRHETPGLPILLNGVAGPAGDGYVVEDMLTPEAAEAAHAPQLAQLAAAGVDLVSGVTFTHAGEAIGLVRAAARAGLPVAVSFTVETDGRLPSGQTIRDAVEEVDAATEGRALYFMVNCAHPDHFRDALPGQAGWLGRIGGLRANASRLSHAELDAAEVLDEGDPAEFGHLHAPFLETLPGLRVIGGCCGTDHRHVGAVSQRLPAGAPA